MNQILHDCGARCIEDNHDHHRRQAIPRIDAAGFVTVNGRRLAVLDGQDWDALIAWLETLDDVGLARQTLAALRAVGGDRATAGWLRWE